MGGQGWRRRAGLKLRKESCLRRRAEELVGCEAGLGSEAEGCRSWCYTEGLSISKPATEKAGKAKARAEPGSEVGQGCRQEIG